MAILRLLTLAALATALSACDGKAVNQAQIYRPISGVVQMEITVPAGESVTKVQFQVNDKVVGEDEDGSDGFSAEVDTSELQVETLAKLAAVGVRPNGSTITLRENFILVTKAPVEVSEEPEPLAEGETNEEAPSDIEPATTQLRAITKTTLKK